MNKIYFVVGLLMLFAVLSGQALDCYFCVDCDYVGSNTKVETCTTDEILPPSTTIDSEKPSAAENYCIYIKYRLINDREKVDRFCSEEPCSEVISYGKYRVGSYCEECQEDKCNDNGAGSLESWSFAFVVFLATFKMYFS